MLGHLSYVNCIALGTRVTSAVVFFCQSSQAELDAPGGLLSDKVKGQNSTGHRLEKQQLAGILSKVFFSPQLHRIRRNKHISFVILAKNASVGSLTNPFEPYSGVVSSRLDCFGLRQTEMSRCLINLINSLMLHAGEASQSKQTAVPKKRKWLRQGVRVPEGGRETTLVADH